MLNFKKERLLVIAPHPDDEVVGCGGLIKKIKDAGGEVFVLFLTVGDTKDFTKKGLSTQKEREEEIAEVAKFLKFDKYHIAFAGNDYHLKLDLLGQKALMDVIERDSPLAVETIKPTTIAFPSIASYNQDHRAAAFAAHAAVRPAPAASKHFVQTVLAYEEPADSWSLSGETKPNLYISLTKEDLDAKLDAMKLYKSQVRPYPNLRSIEALAEFAKVRGSENGSDFAEAFVCFRNEKN